MIKLKSELQLFKQKIVETMKLKEDKAGQVQAQQKISEWVYFQNMNLKKDKKDGKGKDFFAQFWSYSDSKISS